MLWGQAASTPPTSPVSTLTSATTFVAAGVTLLPQTQPHPTGWAVVATEVSTSAQIYSFSETDYSLVNGKFQTSARTGLATPLRKFGGMTLYGLGDAGMVTTGVNTGAAYAGGGVLVIPSGKFDVIVGIREVHTSINGNATLIEVGFGKKLK